MAEDDRAVRGTDVGTGLRKDGIPAKKPYHHPELRRLGSVRQLTLASKTKSGETLGGNKASPRT